MPVKQVRFAQAKTLLPTPAYTESSSSSLPYYVGRTPSSSSSSGLARSNTLPYDYHDHHHLHRPTRRRATSTSAPHIPHLHPMLATSHAPKYDLRQTPTPHSYLSEPATSPPVAMLSLTSPHMTAVHVRPSNGHYITVGDVLHSLYTSLRTNITQSSYDHLSPKDQRRVARAYEDRWRRAPDPGREKAGGVKRVDFLSTHILFRGLSKSEDGNGAVWVVNISQS